MNCNVLYCTKLHCATLGVLCKVQIYATIYRLYFTLHNCSVWFRAIPYCTSLYITALHYTKPHCTTLYAVYIDSIYCNIQAILCSTQYVSKYTDMHSCSISHGNKYCEHITDNCWLSHNKQTNVVNSLSDSFSAHSCVPQPLSSLMLLVYKSVN